MLKIIHMWVNGREVELAVDPRESLLETLREKLNLTSVKKGCGVGECGACTVLIDGVATDVCLYMPTRNEVDVLLLAEPAEAAGKRVWVPKVVEKATGKGDAKAAGTMVFNRFTGLGEEDIITGAYDIRESRSDEILEPGEGTLIIMPGAVFTPWRDRIGYGGGFYDKYLSEHPQCKTIGGCFDLQVVDELPVMKIPGFE